LPDLFEIVPQTTSESIVIEPIKRRRGRPRKVDTDAVFRSQRDEK
jgi:hypothetical protein